MSTLIDVIESRLAKEGLSLKVAKQPAAKSISREFSREKISFPKLYKVEEYLEKKAVSDVDEKVLLARKMQEHRLGKIAKFFVRNPHVNLRNFAEAKSLFLEFFSESASFKENFVLLAQEIDKLTDKFHKYGKAHMVSRRDGKFCLERSSYELGYLKQYINLDYETGEFSVLTVWPDKAKGAELLVSRKSKNHKAAIDSMNFDAEIWKRFAEHGLRRQDYKKILTCAERNHLNLEDFIEKVNAKTVFNILQAKCIQEASITTNSRDTSFFDFDTNAGQHVSIKIAKHAASIVVSSRA